MAAEGKKAILSAKPKRKTHKLKQPVQITLSLLIPGSQAPMETREAEADGDFLFRFSHLPESLDICDFSGVLREAGISEMYKVEIVGRGCVDFWVRSSAMARSCLQLAGVLLVPGSQPLVVELLGVTYHTPQARSVWKDEQGYLITDCVGQDMEAVRRHAHPLPPGRVLPNLGTAAPRMTESPPSCLLTSLPALQAKVAYQDQEEFLPKKCAAQVLREQAAEDPRAHPLPPGPNERFRRMTAKTRTPSPTNSLLSSLLAEIKCADNTSRSDLICTDTRTRDIEEDSRSTEASDEDASNSGVHSELVEKLLQRELMR